MLGTEWCGDGKCEHVDCHRCWPREGCDEHKRCLKFTESGDAAVLCQVCEFLFIPDDEPLCPRCAVYVTAAFNAITRRLR